ncbi:hypothetical protein Trydic_g17813 [Trypoxylus dichotomus]
MCVNTCSCHHSFSLIQKIPTKHPLSRLVLSIFPPLPEKLPGKKTATYSASLRSEDQTVPQSHQLYPARSPLRTTRNRPTQHEARRRRNKAQAEMAQRARCCGYPGHTASILVIDAGRYSRNSCLRVAHPQQNSCEDYSSIAVHSKSRLFLC